MAAFFEQKIRTMFTRFDIDKNGMIEVDDLTKMGCYFSSNWSIEC